LCRDDREGQQAGKRSDDGPQLILRRMTMGNCRGGTVKKGRKLALSLATLPLPSILSLNSHRSCEPGAVCPGGSSWQVDMPVLHGSCLCGGIKYEITGPLLRPLNCHCSKCRKAQGAAFRSLVRVRIDDFRWLQGEELVKYYESSRWRNPAKQL
jgi:hypothetical protein